MAAPKVIPADLEEQIALRDKANQESEEESVLRRKLMLFGRDVGQIPCFRNTFLYGITGGMGSGLAHFACTSNIPKATAFGFYSYVAIATCYWFQCSWQYNKTKKEYQQLQYAMQMNAVYEGTEKGITRTPRNKHLQVEDSAVKV